MSAVKDALKELHKLHSDAHSKQIYFLLAAAGAGIGFAVQKTEGLYLSWYLAPVGIAIVLWGLSFYFGCKTLDLGQSAVRSNYDLLQLRDGSHPAQPDHPQKLAIAMQVTHEALDGFTQRATRSAVWQFRLLIAGAVFFMTWRLLEMVRVTLGW